MADGLGDGCVAVRLDRALEMRRVDQPAVDDGFARALAATRREMAGSEVMFDGVIAIPVAVRGHVVDSYEATYAWHLTERGGTPLPAGRGMVAMALILERPDGSVLWQRRAARLVFGGTWDVSAAGSWHPGEDPVEAAYREGSEELGVPRDRLGQPRDVWMVVGPPPRGVTVLVRSPVPPELVPRPNPAEVDEVRWARTPDELPGDVWNVRRRMLTEIGFPWDPERASGSPPRASDRR
ncbi:MAG: NUDIX hydrolase [Actinobacteria bacterium]|nr:NUDIX hydrolase [Actinomycetota bacterium]